MDCATPHHRHHHHLLQRSFCNSSSINPSRVKAVALNFLLHNVFSSNQWGINQRYLILSEWLLDYLEIPFLLLEVK
ncbi:hypothetical protein EXN66_Car020089 [Channa argus]|uniref:Uncharacterized protein n=1 Tax=Channa argus TaxID=215402 RepID=A0A6G1QNV1_CHAAH|nr:hypothetical protein EXN66_Car020089 [Channa argus]